MADEARAMLDALMGGDRNAPIQSNNDRSSNGDNVSGNGSGSHRNGSNYGKRSCYDPDICPFYCAWGLDVYELFVNTKSDIGVNQCVVDDDAHNEFIKLPQHEKDRLGYEFMLYRKVEDLVKSCDRTVSRNKEKLRIEIQKKNGARGGKVQDLAVRVNEEQVARVAEMQVRVEELDEEIVELVKELDQLQEKNEKDQKASIEAEIDNMNFAEDETTINNSETKKKGDVTKKESAETTSSSHKKKDEKTKDQSTPNGIQSESPQNASSVLPPSVVSSPVPINHLPSAQEYDMATKMHTLCTKIVTKIQEMSPLVDQISAQKRQLFYYRSDTSSDKTVCEISGNFMSSRDADERIAAHYAGKQYVGWKIVRDKCKELQQKYRNMNNRGGGYYGGVGYPGGGYPMGGGYPGGGYPMGGRGGYPGGGNPPYSYHDDRYRERSRSREREHSRSSRDGSSSRRSSDRDRHSRSRGSSSRHYSDSDRYSGSSSRSRSSRDYDRHGESRRRDRRR